jgi:hypothetical protein
MKPIIRIGSLCLIGCSLAAFLPNYPAVAQSLENQSSENQSLENQSSRDILPGDTPPDLGQPIEDVDIATFEQELAPHGRWVETAEYGRVWIPNVDENFRPYATNGRWVVTSYGNTWVSDYEWGWAAFHYGRWYRDSTWGWAWVPGRVWGPAWVSWRSGGGYYGWAPLGPNVSINFNLPLFFWTFVPQTYITSHHINNHYIPSAQVVDIHQNTTVIKNNYRVNNRVYVYGPRKQEIERVTHNRVEVYRVDRLNQPGQLRVEGRSVRIHQPQPAVRQERATNWIPNNSGQPERSRGSFRRDTGSSVIPSFPSNGGNQQVERGRGSFRRDAGSSVIPSFPSNSGNQQIERSRGFSRRDAGSSVVPNNSGNQQIERSRSSRQESFSPPVAPSIPSNGGSQSTENRRFHGDAGGRHNRNGR